MFIKSISLTAISPGHVDFLFRTLAVMIGSNFSPGWHLFLQTVDPWLDISALSHADSMIFEMFAFYERMQAHRDIIAEEFLPQLGLCFVVTLGFLYLCNRAGHYIAQYVIKKHYPTAADTEPSEQFATA